MNHAGEITPLVGMVRPHVAIITTIAASHLGHFDSLDGIADAKAEIFTGVVPGGHAVISRDTPYFDRLLQRRGLRASPTSSPSASLRRQTCGSSAWRFTPIAAASRRT
jgi:UDP-N-acetylmuramyl pentapeptide synthase